MVKPQWLVHKILLGRSPRYLRDLCWPLLLTYPEDQSSSRSDFIVPHTSQSLRTELSLLLLAEPGTDYQRNLRHLHSTLLFKHKLKIFLFTAELQNWIPNWTDYVMRSRSIVGVGGTLEILFVLYCTVLYHHLMCHRAMSKLCTNTDLNP